MLRVHGVRVARDELEAPQATEAQASTPHAGDAAASEPPSKGPADAPVTIVEFSDFECPFCKRVQPTIDHLLAEYDGKVRLVWRNLPLPFHEYAVPAAEAALEAYAQRGDAGFWEMHDRLFDQQDTLSPTMLARNAQAIGLDMPRFVAAMEDHRHYPALREDLALAQKLGLQGTPSFLIGKTLVVGAQPRRVFEAAVDRALAATSAGSASAHAPASGAAAPSGGDAAR